MASPQYAASYIIATTNSSVMYVPVEASGADEPSFASYVEYKVSVWVLRIYRPICALFGMTGNAMCILVVLTTSLRHCPTAVYMVTLAALDWVISLYGIVTLLPKDMFVGEDAFFTESWHCKLYYFLKLFVIHFDTLTMVSMTAQRYVAVAYPLQAARLNTKAGAAVNLVVTAVIAFLANVVHLVTLEIQPFDGRYRGRCSAVTELGHFLQMRVYPWIDAALYFFFPMLSISVINVLIYRALQKAERFKQHAAGTNGLTDTSNAHANSRAVTSRAQYYGSSSPPSDEFKANVRSKGDNDRFVAGSSTSLSEVTSSSESSGSLPPSTNVASRSAVGTSKQLTSMLLSVSVAFLVLTLPMGVFVVVSRYWNPPSGHGKARFALVRDLTDSLMITNHAVNFLLYCLSGRRFRGKAVIIVSRLCPASKVARAARAAGSRRAVRSKGPPWSGVRARARCLECGIPGLEGMDGAELGTVNNTVSSVT